MSNNFRAITAAARAAGLEAGEKSCPRPMVVQEIGVYGDVLKTYEPVMDGVCGFAWIKVRPGNSPFARYLKAVGLTSGRAYDGGVDIWVRDFNQSYEKKMAYAAAYASILQQAGINAYATGRLD